MNGTVCLQGGGEFSRACVEMDADLVRRADGPVVVTALAGAPGREYRTAGDNGVRHYREAGAAEVTSAPDVREDEPGALRSLRSARLLVLPGGSPARLLAALQDTPVGGVVAALLADGGVVMGASAGAMVLCPFTVLPGRPGPTGPQVSPGLGLVPGLAVLPHWSGPAGRQDWVSALTAAAPPGTVVLGIPEESGVLVETGVGGTAYTAVGRSATTLVGGGATRSPGQTWRST